MSSWLPPFLRPAFLGLCCPHLSLRQTPWLGDEPELKPLAFCLHGVCVVCHPAAPDCFSWPSFNFILGVSFLFGTENIYWVNTYPCTVLNTQIPVFCSDSLSMHSCFVLVAQSCAPLCKPMDCSSPGSSVHRILQVSILEWVAIPFSRGSFQLKRMLNYVYHSYSPGRYIR